MQIDISCKNKKCLDSDAFLDTIISFSHLEKKIPFLEMFTNNKQRCTFIFTQLLTPWIFFYVWGRGLQIKNEMTHHAGLLSGYGLIVFGNSVIFSEV